VEELLLQGELFKVLYEAIVQVEQVQLQYQEPLLLLELLKIHQE
jgi:hypothetical protein